MKKIDEEIRQTTSRSSGEIESAHEFEFVEIFIMKKNIFDNLFTPFLFLKFLLDFTKKHIKNKII